MNVQFADILKLLINMQFTKIVEIRDFRNMQHLFKLLNYMVSSMDFPRPNSVFIGGWEWGQGTHGSLKQSK